MGVRDSNDLRAKIQDLARNCDPPVKVLVEAVGKVLVVNVERARANRFSVARVSFGVKEQELRSFLVMRSVISSVAKGPSGST